MIRRPPRSTQSRSSAASDVYKRQQTYSFIYKEWLPNSGFQRKKSDDFELYDHRFQFGTEKSIMEIWVPIEK